MDEEQELPPDWGRRVRAARAYMPENPSVKRFGEMLDNPGMSSSAVRTWEDGKHYPSPMARGAVVRRIAEVTGLPVSFFTADLEGLFEDVPASVEAQLSAIRQGVEQQRETLAELVDRRAEVQAGIEAMSFEELMTYAQAILRGSERVLKKMGDDVGKRDLEQRAVLSRLDEDPPSAPSEAAA